jgi:hypothetical protein
MPKPLAKGGKPAQVKPIAAVREASMAANNNPKLRKLRITSLGEWSDALQAFVINADLTDLHAASSAAPLYAHGERVVIIPGSPFLSSKNNLQTSTGHKTGPTLIKVGDVALCRLVVTPVTTKEPKWVQGLGHVTATYVHDEITWVVEGLFDPSLQSPPAGGAGGGP